MLKFAPIALLATLATFAIAPVAVYAAETSQNVAAAGEAAAAAPSITAGRMIYGTNGQRIAAAYRVTTSGAVQVILDGKLVAIPASSLSESDGKVVTTLTKAELARAR